VRFHPDDQARSKASVDVVTKPCGAEAVEERSSTRLHEFLHSDSWALRRLFTLIRNGNRCGYLATARLVLLLGGSADGVVVEVFVNLVDSGTVHHGARPVTIPRHRGDRLYHADASPPLPGPNLSKRPVDPRGQPGCLGIPSRAFAPAPDVCPVRGGGSAVSRGRSLSREPIRAVRATSRLPLALVFFGSTRVRVLV